ncbi:elongation factor-1 alpha [Methylophaga sp. OBS3]|jgi:hypothetical protein|uniref:elongation factor-1 alpha n=1 Tax=Methylophaga sp. OBS3 TaxID=2991934 RepID=UPI0022575AEA|nr:elongation factor-1 alpha [Methylophaga sp. OBS3]MCX4190310.1 elongation factor-1 alpha [Methylophaga sp. OBS3]
MASLHRLNLASQGTSLKALFTGYLIVVAVGYLMALVQIQLTHGLADGEYGLSIDDIVYSYYGNRNNSLLENKLHGSMKPMATDDERDQIIQWIHSGATEDAYESTGVQEIFEAKCIVCHNADAGGAIPDYSEFQEIKDRALVDTGASVTALARVSHIHLFGIAFIFMFVGLIFSLASGVPKALKVIVISMPYIFLLIDISAWWLTKLNPNFAWFVLIGGGAMAMSFAFMWIVSMYEMWVLPRIREDDRDALLDE